MSRIDEIFQHAKRDFEDYAEKRDLKVKKDPFDVDRVRVQVIKGKDSYLLDREIPLSRLTNVPKYLKEVDLEAFEVLFTDENEQFKIRVNDLGEICSVMDEYRSDLFKKFGAVTVEFYRDNNQLLTTDVNNLKDLINIIKKNEECFHGLRDKEKRIKRDKLISRIDDSGGIGGVVLVGNVIVDEFGTFIADELGNCLSFE
jgi:hypothetical protein